MRPDARILGRRLLAALALALPLAGAPGCVCGPDVMPLEEMHAKNLRTPQNTLDFVRTAVRYDDWDAIYECLSPASQAWVDAEVGRFAFKSFFGGLKLKRLDKDAPPEYAELTVADLLHRSEILRVEADARAPRDLWWVQLYLRIGARPMPMDKTRFPLVRVPAAKAGDPARFTVGLKEWADGW